MTEAFGEKKVAEKFETVSLSHQIVTRRAADLSQHLSCKLKTHISKRSYFSLALDESVDATDISRLMIFARPVDENFDFHKELLAIHLLTGETKGFNISEALNHVVSEYGGFKKCSCTGSPRVTTVPTYGVSRLRTRSTKV